MGISAGGSDKGPKCNINVTPLVDVVLVLLIIFMVTMPVLMRNLTIEIPRKLEADEVVIPDSTTITVCGKADGSILVSDGTTDQSINRIALARTLAPLVKDKQAGQKRIFVDFEDAVNYTDAVSIMDTVHSMGKLVDNEEKRKQGVRDMKIALKLRDPLTENDPCRPQGTQ